MTHDDSTPDETNVDETVADATSEVAADASAADPPNADDADADDADDGDADDADTDAADDGRDEEDPDDASPRSPLASLALASAVAALVAAVVCLGYFGYTGIRAYTTDSARETLRTESVDAAEQAAINITTVDPSDPEGWKKRLESSLTGDAWKQVNAQVVADVERQVAASGSKPGKIESQVSRSAATEVDADENRATVLVYVKVKATVPNQQAAANQMGFLLTMVEVDGIRKAEKVVPLQAVAYSDAGSDVSQQPQPEGGN
ncbi:hypothetical protein [Gordonia sp. (in: high G+C Gram-positive bacteria)]|uniref:hypothetical protein n=1 Tax=Gordonia sp. (in: high G+C Gram-positive bacteria) TaxID=84139 RepID=UPI003C7063EC